MKSILFWIGAFTSAASILYLFIQEGLGGIVAGCCIVSGTILSMGSSISIIRNKEEEKEYEQPEEDIRE